MNKAQIKAELRRSACEDAWPHSIAAEDAISEWTGVVEFYEELTLPQRRFLFLLVAETL